MHQVFELGLLAKGIFAASELVSGLLIWLIPVDGVVQIVRMLTRHELAADPTDRVANWLLRMADGYSVHAQHFWALYLIVHALAKLTVVAGLALNIIWAYPASIVVLVGFIAYQGQQYVLNHDPVMIALTLFDLVMIWLIWHEYRQLKRAGRG